MMVPLTCELRKSEEGAYLRDILEKVIIFPCLFFAAIIGLLEKRILKK